MASLTTGVSNQSDAQTRLQMWLDCEQSIGEGAQSYSIGDRTLTRADLAEVRRQISYWQREVRNFRAIAAGASPGGSGAAVARWNR